VTADLHEIRFQCPNCGSDLHQTIGRLKANEHMTCPSCHMGINIDTDRLANAADEIHKPIEKVPSRNHHQILSVRGFNKDGRRRRRHAAAA
jgi:transcription elongation factor Elf1